MDKSQHTGLDRRLKQVRAESNLALRSSSEPCRFPEAQISLEAIAKGERVSIYLAAKHANFRGENYCVGGGRT